MKGKAWAPGHITGFFEVFLKDKVEFSGSRGAGVNIDRGIIAEVKAKEDGRSNVKSEGVSRYALKLLNQKLDKNYSIKTKFNKKIPTGKGFGASGAECLSSLLAFNDAIGNRFTQNELVNLAHEVEVKKRTGLGDVVSQNEGGLVIRKKEGNADNSEIDKIPVKEKKLHFYVFDSIKTSKILKSKEKVSKINKIGKKKRKNLIREPNLENFFHLSKEFALETELGNKKILDILNKKHPQASMAMLGNSIFSSSKIENLSPNNYFSAKISIDGASLV